MGDELLQAPYKALSFPLSLLLSFTELLQNHQKSYVFRCNMFFLCSRSIS